MVKKEAGHIIKRHKVALNLSNPGNAIVRVLVSVILVLILSYAIIPYYAVIQKTITVDAVGCDGIEELYTNATFKDDALELLKIFDENYVVVQETRTPKDFFEKGGDCKSMANAVLCLAELYDVECKTYSAYYLGYNKPGLSGHIGTICDIEGDGELIVIS